MVRNKRFTQMNAGEMRLFLMGEYKEWVSEGFKSPEWIKRFMRRVSILADMVCLPKDQVLGQITCHMEAA